MSKNQHIDEFISNRIANMGLFASLLVVLIHCDAVEPIQVDSWLYVFRKLIRPLMATAVPFFFIASGFFLCGHCQEKGWYVHELQKRCKTLLLPYFSSSILRILLMSIMAWCTSSNLEGVLGKDSIQMFMVDLGFSLELPHPTTLWYIRCLFFFVILSPLIYWLSANIKRLCVSGVIMLVLYIWVGVDGYQNIFKDERVWKYFFSLTGLCWFFLGFVFRMFFYDILKLNKLQTFSHSFQIVIRIILLGITFLILTGSFLLESNMFLFAVIPILLCCTWICIPSDRKLPFTTLQFPIYILHPFVIYALHFIFNKLLGYASWNKNLPFHLLFFFCAALITITVSFIMTRLFSRFSVLLFGNRIINSGK